MRYRIRVRYLNGAVEESWVGGNNPDEVAHAWVEDCRDDGEWQVTQVLRVIQDPPNPKERVEYGT